MKTQNFFQTVFRDPEFKENILEAKEIIQETSLETGFDVGRKYTEGFYFKTPNDYKIGKIKISDDNNSMGGRTFEEGFSIGLFNSIDLHFHKIFYFPSPDDIKFLNKTRTWDYTDHKIKSNPLMVVASYTPKKTNLFLIQEKSKNLMSEDELEHTIKLYENLITKSAYQNNKIVKPETTIDFFNFLDSYNCDMISFNDSKKIGEKSIEKLAKFNDHLEIDEEFNEELRKKEELAMKKFQEKYRRS